MQWAALAVDADLRAERLGAGRTTQEHRPQLHHRRGEPRSVHGELHDALDERHQIVVRSPHQNM